VGHRVRSSGILHATFFIGDIMYVKLLKTVDLYQLPSDIIAEVREFFHENCPSNDSYVGYEIQENGFLYDYEAEVTDGVDIPVLKELHPKFNQMLRDEGIKEDEYITVLISW
jgi:hypothetical protein